MADSMQGFDTWQRAEELMAVCRTAVANTQAESRRLGVPNFYFIDGQRFYELPNGDYVQTLPSDPPSQLS